MSNDRSPSIEDWTASIVDSPVCAHCGRPREGNYCSECGQRHLRQRLSLGPLFRELFSKLTDLERGLLHTFLSLCTRPGQVARDYCRGDQRQYTNPLTYFFLATALQIISFWTVEPQLREALQTQLQSQMQLQNVSEDNEKLESVREAFGMSVPELLAESYVSAIQQGYAYAALLCFVCPFAALLMLFHRALGQNLQVGETIIFALYTFAQVLLVTACITPFSFRLGTGLHMTLSLSAYLAIPQLAHAPFFKASWSARLMTALATALSFVPFMVSILAIFLATFLVQLLWALWWQGGA